MLKRILLLHTLGLFFITNMAAAAPHAAIAQGEIQADVSYQISKNKETYKGTDWSEDRNVNGHVLEYGVSVGLKNKYALSLGIGNYRYNFYDDGYNQNTKPKLDTVNLSIQKQVSDNFAVFVGARHTSGSWTYYNSVANYSVVRDNLSENTAIVGFIAEKGLTKNINAYAKATFGRNLQEYKLGLSHANFNIGYGYTKCQNINNPEFGTFPSPVSGLDLITKGFYFSFEHKF